jgi:predicted aldo/keto reductase-like oxidoreductase
MYAESYGDRQLAQSTYGEISPKLSAAACLDCPSCTARCVNGLDIASKMEQARRIFA